MAAGSFQVGQRFTVGEVPHRLARQIEPNLGSLRISVPEGFERKPSRSC